jgi:2-polyprenyl-6-methoxyphenol hydroxylase-like FAD-dependent oxidoreductase
MSTRCIAIVGAGLSGLVCARILQRNGTLGGEDLRLLDKTGRVHVDRREPAGGSGRPEIDRTELRRLLVESLEPGTIVWGRKVVAARPGTTGPALEFADG